MVLRLVLLMTFVVIFVDKDVGVAPWNESRQRAIHAAKLSQIPDRQGGQMFRATHIRNTYTG
jgi:hypothetical protein